MLRSPLLEKWSSTHLFWHWQGLTVDSWGGQDLLAQKLCLQLENKLHNYWTFLQFAGFKRSVTWLPSDAFNFHLKLSSLLFLFIKHLLGRYIQRECFDENKINFLFSKAISVFSFLRVQRRYEWIVLSFSKRETSDPGFKT